MTETRVFQHGLQLMAQSPFQRSLSPNYTEPLQGKQLDRAIHVAANAESSDFSDATRFMRQRSPLADARDAEVHSRATTTYTHLLSPQLQQEIAEAQSGSYLKLNILAENAIAHIPQETKLLTLPELNALKKQIADLNDTRMEIENQLKSNSQLIQNTFSSSAHSQETQGIITTIMSSNSALTERLFDVNKEISDKEESLRNQYLLAISFTHMDSISSSTTEQLQQQKEQRSTEDRQADELLSYIASISVQRNVMLPPPSGDSSDNKTQWAKQCLDALLESTGTSSDGTRSLGASNESAEKSKEQVYKLKTALQDLQFAHNYLTKQYETERSMNTTIADTHKNKKLGLENKLSETVIALEKANQRTILIEHEKNVVEAKLVEMTKDFQDLQKQFTQLRLDNLGYVQDLSPMSPVSDKENIPTSPMTGLSISLEPNSMESQTLDPHPKTPLLQQNPNIKHRFSGTPTSPMKFNSSISVMRGEFKKMVKEMQNGYEAELDKEKDERRRLEQLVKMYEKRSYDNDDLL